MLFSNLFKNIFLCLNYREATPSEVWPLSSDWTDNFKKGKFMLTLGQLIQEESWELRRFHLWHMHAAKLGMKDFIVRTPRSTSTWKKIILSPLNSMTCISYCGARTSTSHKSPFLPCNWLHLCVVEVHYDQTNWKDLNRVMSPRPGGGLNRHLNKFSKIHNLK